MAGKIAIYQVLPRLFGNTNKNCIPNSSYETNGCGKLDHFNQEILSGLKDFGYTHIWFTGIIRHASQTEFSKFGIEAQSPLIVKGKAGSPYAIVDYYDVSPDLSNNVAERMSEFEQLVDRCHKTGLKVIIDFVPNHVSRAYKSIVKPSERGDFGVGDKTDYPFHPLNNFYYIPDSQFISPIQNEDYGIESKFNEFSEIPSKATGNDCFTPRPKKDDWYETVKLNYGVDILKGGTEYFNPIPDTWHKMRDILIYWAQKGVDGFRCDMAAMVPLKFWEWVIPQIKNQFHQLTFIAEIYEKNRYEEFINGGFDYLYDKVGLYDTLRALTEGSGDTGEITKCWSSLNGIEDKMLNFLENHDEQRVASDYFASDPFRAIPALTVALLLNRAPFLIYFGQEV
jgi:glycosidase